MKYFGIRKNVSPGTHQKTISPPTDLSYDEKSHYIFLLADTLRALKWRHIFKYFKIRIDDHIFRNIWMVWPFQVDLTLPINKDPSLLDELAQEAIIQTEAILDLEKEKEKGRQLARYNLSGL